MAFPLKWLARLGALVALVAVFGLLGYRYAYHDWPWNQPAKIAVCDGHWERSTLPNRSRHELRVARLYQVRRVPPRIGEQLLSATPVRAGSCDKRLYLRSFAGGYVVYLRGAR